MDLINQFIENYKKKINFYETAGRIAAEMLEDALRSSGIRAMVTSVSYTHLPALRIISSGIPTASSIYLPMVFPLPPVSGSSSGVFPALPPQPVKSMPAVKSRASAFIPGFLFIINYPFLRPCCPVFLYPDLKGQILLKFR